MYTITKITKEKGQFYVVWLSSGEKLRVSEDTLVRQRLLKGQELTEVMIDKIKEAGLYDVGLQLALNYLSYQLRTKKEIEKYLHEKEIPKKDQQNILQRLQEMNLIDDFSYSESYVRTMMRTSDKGPKVLEQQLKKKGVQEEAVCQGMSIYTPTEQLEVAKKTAEKAKKRYYNKSFSESLQKVQLHLIKKGFTRQIIEDALAELSFEKEEDVEWDILKREGDKLWLKQNRLDSAKRKLKVKQSLFQKRFDLDLIQRYLDEKELENDEE